MSFLTATLVLAALASPVPTAVKDPARQVEQLERDLVAAIGRGDLATYDRIVDARALIAEPGPFRATELVGGCPEGTSYAGC